MAARGVQPMGLRMKTEIHSAAPLSDAQRNRMELMRLHSRLRTLERSIRDVHDNAESEEGCICFPSGEPPHLDLRAEIEAAKAVQCPIHGNRFSKLAPMIYVAAQYKQPAHLNTERWKRRSPQYVKAMEASFPPDRWPAQEIVDP